MNWDYADPFVIDLRVLAEDIDGLGHANNAVYVSWLERCAWRHSQRLGLDLAEYRRLDRAMAVLRHEIDYLAAAYEGDELQLATWIVESDQRLRMNRRFQLVRSGGWRHAAAGADHLRLHRTVQRQAEADAGGVHRRLWPGSARRGLTRRASAGRHSHFVPGGGFSRIRRLSFSR